MSYANSVPHPSPTAEQAVESSLELAKQIEQLGAFIHLDAEAALREARESDEELRNGRTRGVLHGVPVVVKDNIHVAGMPNSAGTPSLRNFVPTKSNAVVQSLKAAGAIVIGKTNMHELAFGITSNNAEFGAVRNAHNPLIFAGGSSGGTAVAIASNVVTMGLGTDTGGSTRIPAALNGVVGFRPTLGRYATSDVTPLASTRDTVGPLADTVASVALMDSVITGESCVTTPADLSKLRLGIPREYFYAGLSDDAEANIDSVLLQLRKAGVTIVDVELPDLEHINELVGFPIAMYEFIAELPEYLEKFDTGVALADLVSQIRSPDVKGAAESQFIDGAITLENYEKATKVFRPQLQETYRKAFEESGVDAFIFPTTPCVAQPIETSDETIELNGEQVPTFPTFIRNTDPSSNAGLPSLSLPSGKNSDGLPMGVLLDGPQHHDRRLLEVALAIEAILRDG